MTNLLFVLICYTGIGTWANKDPKTEKATEFQYKSLECENQPDFKGPMTYKWYRIVTDSIDQENQEELNLKDSDRLFVDDQGQFGF